MRPAVDAILGGGRYRLQQRLGAGGMATVWLALDERLERPVAIKIVADTLSDDARWVRRFEREAQAAAALSHPGVVPVFDYGVEDGRPYLVMEYVAGGTLAARLADGRAPAPDRLARELLEALAAVHAAGILHRDIKPANLLFDDRDHVRLTDFGIAQPQDSTSLTKTGMVVGTLRYLAPEVAAGQPATAQSDLFSAGVVIGQVAGEPPPLRLAGLISALTATDAGDRPASAQAALGQLAETTETGATRRLAYADAPTRPLAATVPFRSRSRPRGLTARLVALAAVVVIAIIVILAASRSSGSSGSGGSGGSVPSPAPAGASVVRQVQALDRIVGDAARR